MLSLLHFLGPNLKSSLNKDSLVYLCLWQKNCSVKFLRFSNSKSLWWWPEICSKSSQNGEWVTIALELCESETIFIICIVPELCISSYTQQLAFSLVSPCRAKTRTRQFPGREGEDSFPEVSFKRCFMEERSHWGIIDVKLILKGQIKKYGNSIQSKKRKWVKGFM